MLKAILIGLIGLGFLLVFIIMALWLSSKDAAEEDTGNEQLYLQMKGEGKESEEED